MKVLILGPNADRLTRELDFQKDEWSVLQEPVTDEQADWVISFGYRHILTSKQLANFGRAINIHISVLPWNRGADPNFWSWHDNTPKGVTIHEITKGLDTGPILVQSRLDYLSNAHTLRSSYDVLMREAGALFAHNWANIRDGSIEPVPQVGDGSYHRQADKEAIFKRLGYGYDAPCSAVEALGGRRAEIYVGRPFVAFRHA